MSDLTRILGAIQQGDAKAAEELLHLVYEELRRLAAHKMANEAAGQTLQPTALVHEAWLRLVGNQEQQWNGRAHFFGAAAEAMRRILIENARRKGAQRHGGGQARLDLHEMGIAAPAKDEELLALMHWRNSPSATNRRRNWSNFVTSLASPRKKPPRSWGFLSRLPIAGGISAEHDCMKKLNVSKGFEADSICLIE